MNAIEATGLIKRFGERTAVDGLDLTIREGELFSLLGVNGAGKTTTIRLLCCLCRPTAGDARVLGDSIVSAPHKVKEKTNVSPQETAVAPNLSVRENLEFSAGIYGLSKAEAKSSAEKMLRDFGLLEVEKQRAKTLSGGQQRRLSIAMALISEPRILFLDEPTLGLDVLARRELWHAIEGLKGKVTVVLTTHYMEEAEALSDTIAVMLKGKLMAVGTAADLIARTGAKNFEDAFIALAEGGGAA
jgi:ABC-2 type transport system ATP-binding protein